MPRQSYYDEVEIEDFKWDPEKKVFHYPCPCGDRFEITKGQLRDGDDVATCPSCSLLLRVVYEWVSRASDRVMFIADYVFAGRLRGLRLGRGSCAR